jgi:hypothetical protein
MNLPGSSHFRSLRHFLNHLCGPLRALLFSITMYHTHLLVIYYKRLVTIRSTIPLSGSPIHHIKMIATINDLPRVTLVLFKAVWLTLHHLFHRPMSSAKSESNALCVVSMAASYMRQAYCDLMFKDATYTYTIPIFIDITATEAMTLNNHDTGRTKHIERRTLLHCSHRQAGLMMPYFVNGKTHNIANIGTKANPSKRN